MGRGGNRVASRRNGRSLASSPDGAGAARNAPRARRSTPPENPMAEATPAVHAHEPADKATIWKVIAASAVGTMIEWYDFYIFGSLATLIAGHFFPQGNTT